MNTIQKIGLSMLAACGLSTAAFCNYVESSASCLDSSQILKYKDMSEPASIEAVANYRECLWNYCEPRASVGETAYDEHKLEICLKFLNVYPDQPARR